MLKSGKSSFSVALHFGNGETTVRDIKKKLAELDKYETTFGSPTRQKSLKRPSTINIDQAKIKMFRKKIKIFENSFEGKFGGKEISAVNRGLQ